MTLTLEQVRQTRFRLARRSGYEPVDVDNFVDKVEATLSQLTEENDTLRQQVDASPDSALLDGIAPTVVWAEASNDDHASYLRRIGFKCTGDANRYELEVTRPTGAHAAEAIGAVQELPQPPAPPETL